ncbi:MAG: PH domain-containing protein [Candidatus Micrarchaeota archaeon]|nr:PH domain-containing protein [Candidatus Micrarchaeota archaeon]
MKPNPRAKLVWVAQAMGYALPILFVLLAAGFGLASVFRAEIMPGVDNLFVCAGVFVAVSMLCAFLFYVWAQLRYKGHSFELGNDGVIISDGLIAKRYASIPFSEIAEINYDNEGMLGLAENIFGSYMVTLTTTEGKRARMHGIEDPSEFVKGLMAKKYGITPGEQTYATEAGLPAPVAPEPDAVFSGDAVRPGPGVRARPEELAWPEERYGAGEKGFAPALPQQTVSPEKPPAETPRAKGQTFTILAGDVGEQPEPQDYAYSMEHDSPEAQEPKIKEEREYGGEGLAGRQRTASDEQRGNMTGGSGNEEPDEPPGRESGQRTGYEKRGFSPEEKQDLASELREIRRALESIGPRG